MSVEPSELSSELWSQWQGHVIDHVFPVGRYLGSSDHSGVFQTRSAALGPADVALKLVPADRIPAAESQLARWTRAGGIVHPNLLRLLQWGQCQLDGLTYLYGVMELADQTLTQVLQRRALTEDEVREMLRPILEVLAFLHGQDLVQGQLKPANILVVGDQLKLASDTIRLVGEGTTGATKYDPPEARLGNYSTAGDIWALGMCLFEALTRRAPWGSSERSEAILLPADFPPAFRDIVAGCLNPSPQNRPRVTELEAWIRGQAANSKPEPTTPVAAIGALKPNALPPMRPRITPAPAVRENATPAPYLAQFPKLRGFLLTALLAVAVIVALGWVGLHMIGSNGNRAAPAVLDSPPLETPAAGGPLAADIPKPVSRALPAKSARIDPATSLSALHEVIPEVPLSARRTIRGHIKVWVRVIVDPGGAVTAATSDQSGHSKYFQRLAMDAAWKWTFPPIEAQSRRVIQIRFNFGRDETTGRALNLD